MTLPDAARRLATLTEPRAAGSRIPLAAGSLEWSRPRRPPKRLDRLPFAVALALAALTVGIAWLFRDFNFDDAYIVARYAQNLAAGRGWVFNPGEWHNGATSPLFTLLVAALALAGVDPVLAGHWLAVAALAAAVALTCLLLWDAGHPLGGAVAGLLLATAPLPQLTVGLESTLYLALLAGAAWLYRARRTGLAGLALGLLVLTRGDGAIALALFALHAGLADRRGGAGGPGVSHRHHFGRLAPLLLGAALPVLPWAVWSWLTFGSPLPATLSAKLAHVRSGLWQERPGNLFLDWAAIWLRIFMGPPAVAYPFALAGLVALLRRRDTLLLPVGAVALYFGAYAWLGVVTYHWYMAPVLWALFLLAGAGAGVACSALSRWLVARDRDLARRAEAALAGAVLVGALLANVPALQVAVVREALDPRDAAYRSVGAWLRAEAPPGASVAAVEVGTIAYTSRLLGVDPLGLVSPGLAEQLAAGDSAGWLRERRPDYVVLHDPPVLMEPELWLLPEFRAAYEPVHGAGAPNYRYGLRVFRRLPRGRVTAGYAQAAEAGAARAEPPELPAWRLDQPAGAAEWEPSSQLLPDPSVAGRFRATGRDPFLTGPALAIPCRLVAGIEVRLRARLDSGDLATVGEVYWVRDGEEGFSAERRQPFVVRADGGSRVYRIALEAWDDPEGSFSRLRFDPVEQPGEVEIESIRLVPLSEVAQAD